MSAPLAHAQIGTAGQERFAAFSGDRNPMHLDATAARRTQAGAPVVHGVHTLLWALDQLAALALLPVFHSIGVSFQHWVFPTDEMSLYTRGPSGDVQGFRVEVAGLAVLAAELTAGEPQREEGPAGPGLHQVSKPRAKPVHLSIEEFEQRQGEVFVATATDAETLFPHLSAQVGGDFVAQLAACSYVVGMEAPGLHSTFARLILTRLQSLPGAASGLHFHVQSVDERFRKVRLAVEGSVLRGTLQAFLRHPPAQQARMEELFARVSEGEFQGVRALVVGGSRGLGELAAKSIAAGGGQVTLTYAMGADDARRLSAEIAEAGRGTAATLRYDVRRPAAEQLAHAEGPFTHLLYFATPAIFRPSGQVFSADRFLEFEAFYIRGFYDLCVAMQAHAQATIAAPLQVFYPSSTAVEERPTGMTEYSMAKAAGEQLCRDMVREFPWLQIVAGRLPRLRTDQTASFMPEKDVDPLTVLLPFLREMQRGV